MTCRPALVLALIVPGGFAATNGDDAIEPRPLPAIARGLDVRIELFSAVIESDGAAGLPWQPNEACGDEAELELARMRFKGEVDDRRDWLDGRRRAVDEKLGRTLLHVRTKHFELACGLGEIRVGRKKVKDVEAAALYAVRLEQYLGEVLSGLGVDETRLYTERRHEVFLVADGDDAKAIAAAVLGTTIGGGFQSSLVGGDVSRALVWNNPEVFATDEQFHQAVTHVLAHGIYHDVGAYRNWMFDSHGWLYEGIAYYEEIARFGPPIMTCDPEDSVDFKHWLSPHWEANVKRALKTRRDPEPESVFALGVKEMNAKHRQFAWSYVDFLMWYDRTKMADLLEKTKGEGLSTADALLAAYGLDPATFQSEWRAFVAEKYSGRPRSGPTPDRGRREVR